MQDVASSQNYASGVVQSNVVTFCNYAKFIFARQKLGAVI